MEPTNQPDATTGTVIKGDVSITEHGQHIGDNIVGDKHVHGDVIHGNQTLIQQIIQRAVEKLSGSPYKFLASYTLADRDIFYGRDAVIEEIAGRVPHYRVVIVNGASGSGKTSLVNAGLLPRLAEHGYTFIDFREYSDPLGQVRAYLAGQDLIAVSEEASLVEVLRAFQATQETKLAVVFDQFERFLVNVERGVRRAFIAELKACMASFTSEEMNFVFVLRQDWLGQMYAEIEDVIPEFGAEAYRYNLKALGRAEAREAIIRPLERVEAKIGYDEAFVDEVLLASLEQEGERGGISPPHLQIVCHQLFEAAHKRFQDKGGVVEIDQGLYEELGGVAEILNSYLDRTVAEIAGDAGKVAVVRSMLKAMIETTGTRRFVSLADLGGALPDVNEAEIVKLLEKLSVRRVVEEREAKRSLSHEYMVAQVRSWFDVRELERRKARETLDRGLVAWQASEALLNERQVQHIRQWLTEVSEEEEALLAKSRAAYEKRRRWTHIAVVSIALLAIATSVLAFFTWRSSVQAQANETKALRQAFLSASQSLANGSSIQQGQDEQGSDRVMLLLARQAYLLNRHLDGSLFGTLYHPLRNALETGFIATPLIGHNSSKVTALAFSPDNTTVASGSEDGALLLWSLDRLQRPPTVLPGHDGPIRSMAFSPDGVQLASAGGAMVRLWDLTRGEAMDSLDGYATAVAFSPDRTSLLVAREDDLYAWNLKDPQASLAPIRAEYMGPVLTLAIGPNGQIAAGDQGSWVTLWENLDSLRLNKPHSFLANFEYVPAETITSLVFSPDGTTLAATGPRTGIVVLMKLNAFTGSVDLSGEDPVDTTYINTEHLSKYGPSSEESYISIAYSPDSKTLFTGGADVRVRFWDFDRYDPSMSSPVDTTDRRLPLADISALAYRPDGTAFVSGSSDGTLLLWRLPLRAQPPPGTSIPPWSASASSADGRFQAGAEDGIVRFWKRNPDTGATADTTMLIGHRGAAYVVAFSPDSINITLASGGEDGTVRLWKLNPDTGAPTDTTVLIGHHDPIKYVAFSGDGKLLVSSSESGAVRLWNLEAPHVDPLLLVGRQHGYIEGITFSSEDDYLSITHSDDFTSTLRNYPIDMEQLSDAICERLDRNMTREEWSRFVGAQLAYDCTCGNLPPGEGTGLTTCPDRASLWSRLRAAAETDKTGSPEAPEPVSVKTLTCDGTTRLLSDATGTFWATINDDATAPVTYTWAFGDGNPARTLTNTRSIEHTFAAPGDYAVRVTATNEAGSDTATCAVDVLDPPTP